MLALRLLLRNWRSGEMKILSGALVLAVAVVTAITVFSARMEHTLERQSNSFLAADRIIKSRFEIPESWPAIATKHKLQQAHTASFSSMVFAGDDMHLASVKAVSQHYPLRGELEVSNTPFASKAATKPSNGIPPQGEVWLESRLLALLNIKLGDTLAVGERELTVSNIVIREPDQTSSFSVLGPRVLMNIADLASTEVILPGSRVDYRWLVAGTGNNILEFETEIQALLGEHYQLVNIKDSQQNIGAALARGTNFLILAGMIAVLLASVAIAIAAQQFSARHVDQVALLKSLGASTARIRQLYLSQLLLLATLASLTGLAIGELLQRLIAQSLSGLFHIELLAAGSANYLVGLGTGFVCLLFFALPPLWSLPLVPPIKILRSDISHSTVQLWARGLLGLFAIVLLIYAYSTNLLLTVSVVIGLLLLICLACLLSLGLLKLGQRLGGKAGSIWRLALARLQRNKAQSVSQIIIFGCAVMLLMVLFLLRTSLLNEWRLQLPANAPNHFLLNVHSAEQPQISHFFEQHQLDSQPFYPMVLGRIVKINGEAINEQQRSKTDDLRRELNLSWAEHLPEDNELIQGAWWPNNKQAQAGAAVSVEEDIAKKLNLSIGSTLSFSIGGLQQTATVTSIRRLDWQSMRPNFYFLFSPNTLNQFAPSFMTSVYIPPNKKLLLNELFAQHPTMVVIEVDRIIERIQLIIEQISQVIELILWLVLIGGFFVLAAAVHASMYSRMQEAGLLRALGSPKRLILGSVWLEFSLLGAFSGVLAVIGGEALLACLQAFIFDQAVSLHFAMWFYVPLISTIVLGGFGVIACRRAVSVSPGVVLRELQA